MPVDPTDPDQPLYGASPLTAYARFWLRFAVFTGRASLSEYWWTALISGLIGIVLAILGGGLLAVGAALAQQGSGVAAVPNALGAVLLFALVAFGVAQIVPGIAIAIRRLHDANLSGLFYLLVFIPSVGPLILLVLTVLPTNPEGRRYDVRQAPTGAWPPPVTPAAPLPRATAAAPARANGGFDTWAAPAAPGAAAPAAPATSAAPATAPMPVAAADSAPPVESALLTAWRSVGEVEPVEPRLGVQPSWRRQGYLLVRRPDGIDVLSTNGLAEAEGVAALGTGAELYLAARDLGATPKAVADGWRFTVVAAVARRLGASGMHLPAELEQYGALSLSVPADAPEGWRDADGGVGVLIGVGLPDVPEAVPSAGGEVRLVGLVPLRPAELRRILDGGREERAAIAARLAALRPADLTDPERAAV